MKVAAFIVTLFFSFPSFGQADQRMTTPIEVLKINHSYQTKKNRNETKKITNKQNRPYLVIGFDTAGNVIEKSGYGKHHNTDLRLLDFIEVNSYANGKLKNTVKHITDYEKNIKPTYKTNYYYDNRGFLVNEVTLYYDNDSLFMQFQYEHDSLGNKTKTILNLTYYYKRTFDKTNRLISFQQIYDDKLRWEYTYTYTDTSRIGEFKTYYNDGKDYTKQEVNIYHQGNLMKSVERYTSHDGMTEMTKCFYDDNGLIRRIELYRSYRQDEFILAYFTDIKTKSSYKLTKTLIEKINEEVLSEY